MIRPISVFRVTLMAAATSALADEAAAELARFDAEMGSEIAPFGAILLRSESAASSRIENLTASAKAVALAELGDTSRRNATEIVAYTSAMTAAIALADRLDAPAIRATHAALLGDHDPTIAGRWRSVQVWVGSCSYGPHTAGFVPPTAEAAGNRPERFPLQGVRCQEVTSPASPFSPPTVDREPALRVIVTG